MSERIIDVDAMERMSEFTGRMDDAFYDVVDSYREHETRVTTQDVDVVANHLKNAAALIDPDANAGVTVLHSFLEKLGAHDEQHMG